jgi:hypothetical protein
MFHINNNKTLRVEWLFSLLLFVLLAACGGGGGGSDGGNNPKTFRIGGTVSGLTSSGLILRLNGTADLALDVNGVFMFSKPLATASSYIVTVKSNPTNQVCSVSGNETGVVGLADVTNVAVTCVATNGGGGTPQTFRVGGSATGLTGPGLVLQLNGSIDFAVDASGAFLFPTTLTTGSSYTVAVKSNPTGRVCSVSSNQSGVVGTADVTNVAVTCTASTGGVSPPGSSFRVTLDSSTMSFTYVEGQFPAPQRIFATTSGTPPSSVFIGAVVEGQGIAPTIPVTIIGTRAEALVTPASGLVAGTYTGRILFQVCSDAACNNHIGGSPLPVAYTVVVTPTFKVTPNSLRFEVISGNTAQQQISVQLPNGIKSFTASSSEIWLDVGKPSANSISIAVKRWPSGGLIGGVDISIEGQSIRIPVFYQISPPVGGEQLPSASPSSLTFSTTENATTPAQAINITRASWDTSVTPTLTKIDYTGADAGWLTVTPSANGFSFVASAALRQGTYSATVRVTLTYLSGPIELLIPVSLTVGPGLIKPADRIVTVSSDSALVSLSDSAAINIAGGVPITWTASSNVPWLKLTRSSGTTGTLVTYAIDGASLDTLANFSLHEALVTVTPMLTHVTPIQFKVTLRKQLAEVHYVGPYLLVSGKPAKLHIRGRGFSLVQNIGSRLKTTNLNPTSIVRVNDTTILLDAPPTIVGSNAIQIDNALGFDTGSAVVRTIAPQSYQYTAIPVAGIKRSVVFDAERLTLYCANVGAEALTRLRYRGGTWLIDALSVPAILDVGIGPDGGSLVVTATPRTLRLVDPVSFVPTLTQDVPAGLARNFAYLSNGISTTNNGWSWLTFGEGSWGDFGYFDHRTGTVERRPEQPTLSTSFYNGPWTAISRDGERMWVPQAAGLTPSPPLLYLDATTPLLKVNPIGLTYTYDMQLSEDGSRVFLEAAEVRDQAFGLIGRTPLPTESPYFGIASAISPDGTRAYVLAYNNNGISQLNPAIMPRIFVFDSTAASATSVDLPLLGGFDLQHYPTCPYTNPRPDCALTVRSTISPDGATLFFAGSEYAIIAPIPANLRTAAPSRAQATSVAPRRSVPVMQQWPLS